MDTVKPGKKGQVSPPRNLISELSLGGEAMLLIEKRMDGAILLRLANVHHAELYSDECVKEFLEANEMIKEEGKRLEEKLKVVRHAC